MKTKVPRKLIEEAISATGSAALTKMLDDQVRFGTTNRNVEIEVLDVEKKSLKFLYDNTKDKTTEYANMIEFVYQASKNPAGTIIHRMKDVLPALTTYCSSMANGKHYLFERGPNKMVLPYVITAIYDKETANSRSSGYRNRYEVDIPYVKLTMVYAAEEQIRPEGFTINPEALRVIFDEKGVEYKPEMKTVKRNKDEDDYTYMVDCYSETGIPVDAILAHYGYFLETDELHQLLEVQTRKYLAFVKLYGQQFLVRGVGEPEEVTWYNSRDTSMLVEGKPGRAIMDTVPPALLADEEDKVKRGKNRNRYRDRDEDDEDPDAGVTTDPKELALLFEGLTGEDMETRGKTDFPKAGVDVLVPAHPRLRIFHLTKNETFWVHVNNLLPYKYIEGMDEKLILPQEVKDLTKMLVYRSMETTEDVIEGKTQSTIIAAVGDPGLGKTLMCEVLSESCRKPLYRVQAAQLGQDAEELEKSLRTILTKAQRWNAILMIDEANAYIHSRGSDVKQNAIVGVFLRLLDYYRGILVFTTNMTSNSMEEDLGFDIDIAIQDRCTAIIRFELPSTTLARKLWLLQANLQKVKLEDALIKQLVTAYKVSGRSIRNLLGMAVSWSLFYKEDLSFKHFEAAARYVPMSAQEQKRLDSLKVKDA